MTGVAGPNSFATGWFANSMRRMGAALARHWRTLRPHLLLAGLLFSFLQQLCTLCILVYGHYQCCLCLETSMDSRKQCVLKWHCASMEVARLHHYGQSCGGHECR